MTLFVALIELATLLIAIGALVGGIFLAMPSAWGWGMTRHPGMGATRGGTLRPVRKNGNNSGHRTLPNTVLYRYQRRREMLEKPTT